MGKLADNPFGQEMVLGNKGAGFVAFIDTPGRDPVQVLGDNHKIPEYSPLRRLNGLKLYVIGIDRKLIVEDLCHDELTHLLDNAETSTDPGFAFSKSVAISE